MSSGLHGESHLELVDTREDPVTVVKSHRLESEYFGEGVSLMPSGQELLMMTYQSGKAFRFDKDSFELKQVLDMPDKIREGWGMTHTPQGEMLVSDGTDKVYYINPEDFSIISTVEVF
jgi:glutamine cyclotransferase